jgi:transposase
MGRAPGMTLPRRHMAIGMLNAGMTAREVARQFHVSDLTISSLKSRYQLTGDVKDMQRSGRQLKTTLAEYSYIVVTSRQNRFVSSRRLANHLRNSTGTRICVRTVRNRLHAARLHGRRPHVGIPLTRRHRRVAWARIHKRWNRAHWNGVPFTDESIFNLSFADGRLRVWRRKGERFDPENVIQRDRYGGGIVMI